MPALGYAAFTVAPARPGGGGGNAAPAARQRAWLGGRRTVDNATEPQVGGPALQAWGRGDSHVAP